MIYTTNAIESLNSTYRNLKHRRSVFPSDTALLRALYLATFEATQKRTSTQQSGIVSIPIKMSTFFGNSEHPFPEK